MATTRTYDDIYEDIAAVELPRDGRPYFERLAEHYERLRGLWDEVARLATDDRTLPPALALAPVLLRDQYDDKARAARAGR